MIPITRKELYLNKIVGNNDYSIPEKPISEEEFFFAEILGEAVQAPEPFTRYQMYLAKIAKRDIEIPYPETRLELFLAKACGMDIETPVPITKEEIYWSNYTAIVEFELEGVPPLTYKVIEGTLENYRIYGNTVDGESVGDKTPNLFDNDINKIPTVTNNVSELYVEKNEIVAIASGSDMYVGNISTTYSIGLGVKYPCTPGKYYCIYDFNKVFNKNYITFFNANNTRISYYPISNAGAIAPDDSAYFTIRFGKQNTTSGQTYRGKLMITESNTSSLPDTYEPYGYKVPVTVSNGSDTITTPIYLPEQIRKVGDEAEYVDYAEQKLHRIGADDVDVTLPALPTSTGTNVLSVGTAVQPSKVYIKGEKGRE